MKKETTLVLKLIVALAVITGCTKTRQAELPDDAKENVYAISEFGTPDSASFSANKIEIDSATPSLKALDDSATLSSDEVTVPARLKFMFDKLPLSGLTTKNFKITFTVDKNYVTSYKIVNNVKELSVLERGLAITLKEAQLLVRATKSTSTEAPQLFKDQQSALTERQAIIAGQTSGVLAVPLFKYKVEGYGIVERTKNELKENTSVLQLKKTDFKSATHIQITSTADSRLLVGINPEKLKELGQLFDEKKIDNQVMTVGTLQSQLKVGLGFMSADEKVFTRLDADVMHVYRITKTANLNEFGQRLLKTNSGNQQVISCKDPSVAPYISDATADCVLALAADFNVGYVSSQLTLIDEQGNTSNEISFNKIPRSRSVGLVSIIENTAATPKYITGTLDPKNAIKVSDIINKEFFFRRTFADAPSTSMLMPGLAGDLLLAKFVLEEKRIVVKAAEKFINYKNENSNQFEDLMSVDAKYYKLVKVDANGTVLTIPKMTEATMDDADYIILDWTQNALPIVQSPLSMTTYGQCLGSISNNQVSDVVYKNDGELVLNFTYNYTAMLRPECATYYDTQNYNGGDTATQQVHAIRERISFRENKIKKADEKVVSSPVPFPAQNKMGYGLFTKGIITPTVNGDRSLTDGQLDLPIVHDFTNGQKLVYTIGGLADNDPQRQMVIDLTLEVIADWNKSLRMAFKGTSLERSGDYIVGVVNGDGSDKSFLG
ncbi:MAG: hypothetical protein H7256_11035, partial [Bdellovibrio sp.]|nr:hypothetical protein [Bdellovibrio sp.]